MQRFEPAARLLGMRTTAGTTWRRGWGALLALLLSAALLSPATAVAGTSAWHTLGTDKVGDQEPAYADIRAMHIQQTSDRLIVRFEFRDLPGTPAPGARVGAHLSRDGGRRWCCFLRGDLGPLGEHSISFDHRDSRPDVVLEGRYDGEKDRLTLLLPLEELGFESGQVLAGCSGEDGSRVCDGNGSVYTSPTFGMYGYDGLRITNSYRID